MAAASQKNWNPIPPVGLSAVERHDYAAGYSDGFYRYPAGAGHAQPNCTGYRAGFQRGTDDANAGHFDFLAAARDVKIQARNLRLMRDE